MRVVTPSSKPAAYGWLGALIHSYARHSAVALYLAAAGSALLAVAAVYLRCRWTDSVANLKDKWIFTTAAGAAPIPTYLLLMVVPLDPDLGQSVLDDRVVVALAGLYGLVEALKDVRGVAADARGGEESVSLD